MYSTKLMKEGEASVMAYYLAAFPNAQVTDPVLRALAWSKRRFLLNSYKRSKIVPAEELLKRMETPLK